MTFAHRALGVLGALALALVVASAASASSISMVWISTSGAGLGVGTPTLTNVSLSDTAVLEVRWTVATPTSGIQGVGIRAQYDPTVIIATAIDPCPATVNNFFGGGGLGTSACGSFGTNIGGSAGFLPSLTTTFNEPGSPQGASTGTVAATTPGAGQANGSMWELAHITFHVTGAGTTGGYFFKPGVDGQVPIGGGFSFPTSPSGFTLSVAPEPGSVGLLVLGVGILALAGRPR